MTLLGSEHFHKSCLSCLREVRTSGSVNEAIIPRKLSESFAGKLGTIICIIYEFSVSHNVNRYMSNEE